MAAGTLLQLHPRASERRCVTMHPGGKLAATGQGASAFAGTAPWLAVWDIKTKQEVARVGCVSPGKSG